ncbi:hypothetical protein OX88_26460 [Pseudomonas coronafaciens pv. porri]|nr:hypothetical protein OX88_26460 [Pseudomonas coronafaciens pv. porri]
MANVVEKVNLLPGLRQNQVLGQRKICSMMSSGQKRLLCSFDIEGRIPANRLLRSIDQCLDPREGLK